MAVVCAALLIGQKPLTRRHWIALAAGAAIATVAVLPVGIAYLGAHEVVGERSAEEVERGSALPVNYIGPPEFNLVYGTALKRFAAGERRLFPGFVAIGLAIVALVGTKPRSREDTKFLIAYGLGLLIAFDLSLGFNGISYRILYEYVLPFRGLRVPARMGVIVGFSLAVLAGFAIASLIRRFGQGIAIAVALLMLVEYASKPLDLRQIPTTPPESYADAIKDSGDSPTATLFEFPASALDDPTYMRRSRSVRRRSAIREQSAATSINDRAAGISATRSSSASRKADPAVLRQPARINITQSSATTDPATSCTLQAWRCHSLPTAQSFGSRTPPVSVRSPHLSTSRCRRSGTCKRKTSSPTMS